MLSEIAARADEFATRPDTPASMALLMLIGFLSLTKRNGFHLGAFCVCGAFRCGAIRAPLCSGRRQIVLLTAVTALIGTLVLPIVTMLVPSTDCTAVATPVRVWMAENLAPAESVGVMRRP